MIDLVTLLSDAVEDGQVTGYKGPSRNYVTQIAKLWPPLPGHHVMFLTGKIPKKKGQRYFWTFSVWRASREKRVKKHFDVHLDGHIIDYMNINMKIYMNILVSLIATSCGHSISVLLFFHSFIDISCSIEFTYCCQTPVLGLGLGVYFVFHLSQEK